MYFLGVLQELGSSEQEFASQREAERYVVKMDQSAQSRIDKLLQEAQSNSYTLYILVHDHAHWDISRFGLGKLKSMKQCNKDEVIHCIYVTPVPISTFYSSTDGNLGLVDRLLNSRQVKDATNILILHVTSFPFALQTQCTRISPYNEIHWPSAFSNVSLSSVWDGHLVRQWSGC